MSIYWSQSDHVMTIILNTGPGQWSNKQKVEWPHYCHIGDCDVLNAINTGSVHINLNCVENVVDLSRLVTKKGNIIERFTSLLTWQLEKMRLS